MGKQNNPHGKRFRPLREEEIEQYDKAARDSGDTLTELTTRALLYTGLRNGEFSHLRESWLASVQGEDYGILHVPGEEECIGGAGAVGRSSSGNTNPHERGAACYTCRNTRDGQWAPATRTAIREIPIVKEDVYELLEDWFETHEQIPLLHNAVGTRVQHVAERAGLSRQVKPHDLRHTYGTMLARRGFDLHTIADVLGHRLTNTPTSRLYREARREFEKTWEDSESDDS